MTKTAEECNLTGGVATDDCHRGSNGFMDLERDLTLPMSQGTVEDVNVNFNKPWRKSIRRYIDFGRGGNDYLRK